MQFLHLHLLAIISLRSLNEQNELTISSQSSRLITKQVLYTSKLLWESARAYDGVGYFGITHNLLCIDRLPHIQIDTQTVRRSVTAKF